MGQEWGVGVAVLGVLFLAAVAVVVIRFAKWGHRTVPRRSAEETLRQQNARGEIDGEEYARRLEELRK